MKRKFNQFMRYLKRNPLEVFFILVLLLFICFLLVFGFNKFLMKNYLQHHINSMTNDISDIQTQIQEMTGDANYKKYMASKYLEDTVAVKSWGDTISSLITIFDDFRNLSNGGLTLKDFKVDTDEIQMKGEVNNLAYIYGDSKTLTGGIISKIEQLNFVQYIDIPFYNKLDKSSTYTFNLAAKINKDATTNNSATGSKDSNRK